VRLPLAGTPPQAVEATIPHSGFDEVGSGTTRNAVVLFRGHEFRAPVVIRPVGGTEVSHVPSPLDFADVLVLGPMQKHASLVFVLDCSGSMQQPLPLEGAEGARRFDAAILAVRQLLVRLAEMGDARVGVILYGHRARWDHERRDQVLYQKRYSRAVPANQMPYDDVEPVLPLGRFDATIAAQVSDLLGTLEPWGETPLYLALLEAVQQFTTWDDAYDRHIVVVTDGINQQFNAPAERRKQVQDVIAAIAGRPIAMHIVGFGIPQGQVPQARAAFDALARANRGSYMPIDDAARLLDHLQGLLGERTFTIREADGREHQSAVGSALRLENLSALVQPLQVRVDNIVETLTVQGGESLRLSPQSDGTLGAEPYLAGRPLFQPLVSGGASSGEGWLLGVHRPLRTAAQVQFEFSLQHPRGRIAPHPAEVWIEATPVLSSGERATPFTFYDREFLVGTSVPVLKAVAENWPANASRASVRAWFRFERAAPIVRVPLGEIEARKAIVVPGLPWVALHIERVGADGGELRVVEQYTAAAPEFPALRIDSSDPRTCRRIIRRFDPDQRVCVHRFELDAAPAGRDASSEMWITPRSRLQDRAWELVAPVQVDIAATEGLIVPAASR
jgi:hypothetical protein